MDCGLRRAAAVGVVLAAACTTSSGGVRAGFGLGLTGVQAHRDLDFPDRDVDLGNGVGGGGYVELASVDAPRRDLWIARLSWTRASLDPPDGQLTAHCDQQLLNVLYAPELFGRRDAFVRALLGPCVGGVRAAVPDAIQGGDFAGPAGGVTLGLEAELLRRFTLGATGTFCLVGYPGETIGTTETAFVYFGFRL